MALTNDENSIQGQELAELEANQNESEQTGNPYDDLEEINARIDTLLETDRYSRSLFEREWFRNVLFDVGQQWIIYDAGRWRPRRLPTWYPRAQTNKFAEKKSDIVSQLEQTMPQIAYEPATDDADDVAIAEVGERIREVIYEETEIDSKRYDLDNWLTLTGNAFIMLYYDTDEKYGKSFVQSQRCVTCGNVYSPQEVKDADGTCPECAQQGIEHAQFEDAVDPDGNAIGDEYPIGKLCADVCSPFEIHVDHRITNMADQRRFIRRRRYDLDFAKEQWSDYADQIHPSSSADLTNYYLDQLSNVTQSFGAATGGFVAGPEGVSKIKKVTAYEYYELPSEKFPDGIRAVRLGESADTIVEAGPLPNEFGAGAKTGQKFMGIIHFGFDKIPGRFWRKSKLDDLVPLQLFRNTIESNMRLTVQRTGNPMWLKPKGSGVGILTGEPGQEVEYNPITMGGASMAKPERIPAELNNIQPLTLLMNKIDDSMERVAGTFFLQGGETPPGVTAASALAYLGERAQKAMSPLMREYARSWKQFEEYALEIARANWDDKRIRVIAGRNRKWEVEQFSKADLKGAVKMKINYESLFPKSQATTRAEIAQLVQLQVIQPQDPEQGYRILEKFGLTDIKGSSDLDMKEATHESERFLTENQQPNLVPLVQNSVVHLMQHTDFAKSDEFKELDPQKQAVWFAHIQAHVVDIVQRRVFFQQAQLPDTPMTAEISSGEAGIAAQAAQALMPMAMGGGMPDGSQGPDQRIGPNGRMKPKAPGARAPGGAPPQEPTPDIAQGVGGNPQQMPPGVKAIQQPRAIAPGQQAG